MPNRHLSPGRLRRADPLARVEAADVALALRLAAAKDHPAVRGIAALSEAGSQQALLALCGGILAYGLATGDPRARRAGLHALVAHGVASGIKTGIKRLVRRTRPNEFMDTGDYVFAPGGIRHGPLQSFPSGHAAVSVAVARSLGRTRPGLRPAADLAAAAVALAQLPRGAHYPADVVAGVAIGLVAEAAAARLLP
ncbi:phosphatase PAP2 family protein [Methylobacterium sp. ID0610]|uniref:phosphatase PAP2 family protein n=1 Tax=Methylobacterium carpenticola TaxID=3344827 RepID=UPI0036B73542